MSEEQRAKIVLRTLNKIYPKTPIPLKHRNIFTLLVSVLLSAQCTDVNVNNVTKNIYPKYNKPEHFVKLGRKKIEKLIKSIGIFRIKAKSVYNLFGKKYLNKKSFPYGKKINFNSIRKGKTVGEHEVKFSSGKEIITLNHEAFDRTLYSEGALTAGKWLMKKKPGLYSMRDVLNFK